MDYMEKIYDLREVISMLIEINDNLCNEVECLQAEVSKKKETVEQLTEKNQKFFNQLTEISDSIRGLKDNKILELEDSLKRKIYDETNTIKYAVDGIIQSIQNISEEISELKKEVEVRNFFSNTDVHFNDKSEKTECTISSEENKSDKQKNEFFKEGRKELEESGHLDSHSDNKNESEKIGLTEDSHGQMVDPEN